MRILPVSSSLLALAVCAGCAQQPSTTAMGAGPGDARAVYCRDGAWMSKSIGCGSHGGVERDATPAAQK